MPAGRPLKFETVDILQSKIDDYFNTTKEEEWTITGLALHLDTDRLTLIHYEERPEFVNAVKKAKMKVENGYEKDLKKHGRSGTIFALKNFDWTDKTEVKHEGIPPATQPSINIYNTAPPISESEDGIK